VSWAKVIRKRETDWRVVVGREELGPYSAREAERVCGALNHAIHNIVFQESTKLLESVGREGLR